MEDYPKTLMEFEKRFFSEEACREYLFQLRWPNGFVCPHCQHTKAWKTDCELYHCTNCGLETSVTAVTIFHGTSVDMPARPSRTLLEVYYGLQSVQKAVFAYK